MNPRKLAKLVESSQQPWFWDFGNKVLYDLCRRHPHHRDPQVAAAKIWLIGRSYAAAIERRRPRDDDRGYFYRDTVAPTLCGSAIDQQLASLRHFKSISTESFDDVVVIHGQLTELFNRISDQNKRSLASKYLHFHAPELFFIYDSVALKGLRQLSDITGRARTGPSGGDRQYRAFAEKCLRLRDHIRREHGRTLSPRRLDRLLLELGMGVRQSG